MVIVKSTVAVDVNQTYGLGCINSINNPWSRFTRKSIPSQLGMALTTSYRKYWFHGVTLAGVES
jgi:hypothetical protein